MINYLRKYLKSTISLVLVAVMVFGFLAVPAEAATTSTAPRIYSDLTTSAAYKKYTQFAKLYVPEYSTPIPGLTHTDVNGTDCTTMVPQGICLTDDYMIISAYDSAGKCNSVLYVLSNHDPSNRQYLMTIVLPMDAHVGGTAFDGTYLWVANGRDVSSIKYSTLVSTVESAVANNKKSVSIKFHSTCTPATGAAFLAYGMGMLWVGQIKPKGDSTGRMYSYEVSADGKKLTKKYYITLPDRIQGACFKDGYLILSRSNGRNISGSSYISELRVYKYSEPSSNGNIKKNSVVKVITLPPMSEGLTAGTNYMYTLFESAATKYYKGNDGNGKCKYPVDRVVAFKFSDFIDVATVEPEEPEETVTPDYFPACDANEDSLLNALAAQGFDSSVDARTEIALANGISAYSGTASQDQTLLSLMKEGKLINPGISVSAGDSSTVTLDVTSTAITVGNSTQITSSFTQGMVSWKSSNTNVATVSVIDDHTVSVQGVQPGKATITCTLSNGNVAKCTVVVEVSYFKACDEGEISLVNALTEQGYDASMRTRAEIASANDISGYCGSWKQDQSLLELMKDGQLVNPGLSLIVDNSTKVTLSKTTVALSVGGKISLDASFTGGTVTWKSSDTRVVKVEVVDSDTVSLVAVGKGKATITCTFSNGGFAKCVVSVNSSYFAKCSSTQDSIVNALKEQEYDSSFEARSLIAAANGISNYSGSAAQNDQLIELMRAGKLINPGLEVNDFSSIPTGGAPAAAGCFPKCGSSFESIAKALESVGVDGSYAYRKKIAEANGISNYSGTADQNIKMLDLMKAGKLLKPAVELGGNEYLVTFNSNGGTGTMSDVVLTNGSALPANTFTQKGYTFQGWATYATGSVVYKDMAPVDLAESITLYAVWTPIVYRVTYNANGGTGTMSDTLVTYGIFEPLNTPGFTRDGYTLTGWYRYRTSDNKWYYTSADGTHSTWYAEGSQPSGYTKNVMSTTTGVSKSSPIDGDTVILYAVWKAVDNSTSLSGKKILFIGNSMVYYGGVVETGSQKKADKGWFYQICQANGDNVTVIDATYGSHHLYDYTTKGCKSGKCHNGKDLLSGLDLKSFDYVFMSESGNNNSNFVRDVKNIMKRFPSKTKFFYLSHSYTYFKNHTKITKNLSALEKLGVGIVEWGKLVEDIVDGRVKVSGATVKYNKYSFNKNKGDTYHPNPLSGYITAQMAYCALTGKSAVGQMPDVYKVGNSVKYGKSAVGYSAYVSKHYKSSSSSNFITVLKSKADVKGLQKLMDQYLAKWSLGVDAKK